MADRTPAPAVTPPDEATATWPEKLERALRARELGRALRAGKPGSFRPAVGRQA